LIFPWQPLSDWGHTVLVTRSRGGLAVSLLMVVGFIRCSDDAARVAAGGAPSEAGVAATRSVWLTEDRPPDASATAVYEQVWFSADAVS
jgi:protein-L-isoaspartate(D-aspartate) O-methyltransferase